MSIINEALKKAQQEQSGKPILQKKSPSNKQWRIWLQLSLILLIGGMVISYMLPSEKAPLPKNASASRDLMVFNPVPQSETLSFDSKSKAISEALDAIRSNKEKNSGQLSLSGIALMDGDNYAIINDQVFREGDEINGVTLLNIGNGKVELGKEGEEITLSLQ